VPGACSNDRVSLFRSPAAALVGASPVVGPKNWIDHCPRGLNRAFTRKERSIADHGVAQKPLVGRFLSRLIFEEVELTLFPDEIFSCELDASGEGNGRTGREPEAQVVGRPTFGIGAESAKSLCGGGFSSTMTSVAVSGRYLPERRYQGTPSQRHESMNSRTAQKVSTSEFFATSGSFR